MSEDAVPFWESPHPPTPLTLATRALADELRGAVDDSVTAKVEESALAEATALIAQARTLLTGPPRVHFSSSREAAADPELAYREWSTMGGRSHAGAIPMALNWDRSDPDTPVLVARCTLTKAHEGAPGCAHGGWVASVIDELLGMAQSAYGKTAATVELTLRYKSPTPLYRELEMRAWFDRVEGRRLHGRATCYDGDRLCAEAEAVFVNIALHTMQERSQQ